MKKFSSWCKKMLLKFKFVKYTYLFSKSILSPLKLLRADRAVVRTGLHKQTI